MWKVFNFERKNRLEFFVYEDKIYCLYYEDDPRCGNLLKMDLDGSNEKNIAVFNKNISNITMYNNDLYYACNPACIEKYDIEDKTFNTLTETGLLTTNASLINMSENYIFYWLLL